MQWIFGLIFVVLIVGLAVFSLIRNKKQGKTSCGCGCTNCALNGECHKNNKMK